MEHSDSCCGYDTTENIDGLDGEITQYEGVICETAESAQMYNANRLSLGGNELSGSLPSEIGMLTAMTSHLNLWGNLLSGSLPSEIGMLTAMTSYL